MVCSNQPLFAIEMCQCTVRKVESKRGNPSECAKISGESGRFGSHLQIRFSPSGYPVMCKQCATATLRAASGDRVSDGRDCELKSTPVPGFYRHLRHRDLSARSSCISGSKDRHVLTQPS